MMAKVQLRDCLKSLYRDQIKPHGPIEMAKEGLFLAVGRSMMRA